MFYRIVLFLFLYSCAIIGQTPKSEAFKKQGFSRKTPLVKPKYPSYNLAATYVLTEKARKGDPFAQHELGIRYILGVGVPIDTLQSANWIGKAASKNLPAANFNYGIMLQNGMGVDWNPFKAFKNFRVAAESGMEQAQYIIGLMYADNLIVNKNLIKSKEWLQKSAKKGFEEAKKVLQEFAKQGMITLEDSSNFVGTEGKSVPLKSSVSTLVSSDYELDFFNFSEDSLSASEEKEMLNDLLQTKSKELKKMLKISNLSDSLKAEDTTAIGLINLASNSGSPEAILIRARLDENGLGVKQNYISAAANYLKAFRLGSFKAAESLLKISQKVDFYSNLETAIKNNNSNAMYVWAGLIALGLDYSLSEEQAFELLKKAEDQNHINSIIELGLAYYSGSLGSKDSVVAIEYFEKAASLNSSEAKIRLAFLRAKDPNSINKLEIISVLNRYADEGSVLAEAALAYCYENALIVKLNKGKAANLYRRAAQRGNEAAYNSLRKMYDDLRPADEEFQIYL